MAVDVQNGRAIEGEELWAEKPNVKLAVWRKRSGRNQQSPVLALVHGSSIGARASFDLHVAGKSDYSMMDWFARRGYDVWAMDHEGYGRSTDTGSNSDVGCGVEDLRALAQLIRTETGQSRFLVYGMSSGALRAAAFAARYSHFLERLALDAFVWTGHGSTTLQKRREGLDLYRRNARRPIDAAYIESIFTRDAPGLFESEAAAACAKAQLSYGNSVPTGTYLDMTANLPLVDPIDVKVPTLMIRPEHDGIATVEDLLAFFVRLPTQDKHFAVVPGVTHASIFGIYRHRVWHALDAFLRTP